MTSPGWYNDERDPRFARWHDGRGWTEHTMAKDAWTGPGSPPPPAEATSPPPVPSGAPLGRPPILPPSGTEPERPVPLMEARPPVQRSRRGGLGRNVSPHLVSAIVSLVVVAICLLGLQRIDEDHDADVAAEALSTTTTLPSVSAEWTAADGSTYRVTAIPGDRTESQASTSGCLPAPRSDRLNATFTIRIENTSINEDTPIPQLAFGVNVGDDGAVDPNITTLDAASSEVEMGPVAAGTSCSLARTVSATNGDAIPPGGSKDFTGTVADVPKPLPTDLRLIVRYFPKDDNPRGPGFVNADLVADFPDTGTAAQPGD